MTKLDELRSDIITHHDQVRRIQMELEEMRSSLKGSVSDVELWTLQEAINDLIIATKNMEHAQRTLVNVKLHDEGDTRDYDAELKDNQLDDKYGY